MGDTVPVDAASTIELGYHDRPSTVTVVEESVVHATGAEQTRTSDLCFSVVIPTFRRPTLLAEAIASVVAQSYRKFEILVVDDDPEMSAKHVLEAFSGLPIRYLVNEHARGGSGARNTGAFAATGEWVAFLDDDDCWLPNKLEAVQALITAATDPELVLIYSANEKYDFETGEIVSRSRPQLRGRALSQLLYKNHIGGMSVAVVKRAALVQLGGLDERFLALQDMELYVRLAEIGTIDFVAESLVRIRVSSRSRITFDPDKKLQGALLFSEKFAELLGRDPRLRHRDASRILTFALAAGRGDQVAKALLWTMAGLVVDPANVTHVIRSVLGQLNARNQRGARLRPTER